MDDELRHHDGERTGARRGAGWRRGGTSASAGGAGAKARGLLPLRVACGIGVADSVVALSTAVVARPQAVSVAAGILWVLGWTLALLTVARWAAPLSAHAWVLVPLGVVALLPALFDGGYPGNLATQPMWIVLVAAAAAGWPVTLASAVALSLGKLAVFLATGTTSGVLLSPGASDPAEATTAILAPLAIALLGLVGVTVLRSVLRALAEPAGSGPPALAAAPAQHAHAVGEPPPAPAAAPPLQPLSPAERAVVALLADGLTPKQIAHQRGTSLETVRTQIKRAKRATRARTLDELVASGWRPS